MLLVLRPDAVLANDWPQWRGPSRDGDWTESGIVDSIPAAGLPVAWRTRVLNGYSGPAVSTGRVFLTDHNYKSNPEVERVLCFDEQMGKLLWRYEYPCVYADMEYGNGPRATPAVHDGMVYTLGTKGHLVCLNAETGALVWQKDLAEEEKAQVPRYGASVAPLVDGNLVIVSVGARPKGTMMAFDVKTGAERWRALSDRPAYSAPIIVKAAGRRQLIVWTADNVNGLDPATGDVLWQVPYKATFDAAQAVATPVSHNGALLCLGAWNRGSMMLKLKSDKPDASVLWKTRSQPATTFATPIFRDEKHFYAITDGALCCLDTANGNEIWSTRAATSELYGTAHIVTNGDRCFLFNQNGHLIMARMTPDGYQEFGRMALVEPTAGYRAAGRNAWAHPAFANKHVFARNDRELVCVSLAADATPPMKTDEIPTVTESKILPGTSTANENQVLSVAVSPDGKTVAIGSGWGLVKQIDLASATEQPGPTRHNDWVCAVAYSPDSKYLVSAGGSEFTPQRNGGKTSAEIKVWDVAAKAERGKLEGHTNKIFAAAFSPDGKTLATGSADQTIRLWNVGSMKEQSVLRGHHDAVSSLAWSRDGKLLASASWDRTVKLWDAARGSELTTLCGTDEELLTVAVSPNGQMVAAGGADWNLRIWDLRSRRQQAVLRGHRGAVYCAVFSPDGKVLATGSGDETIRLWNADSGAAVKILRGHSSGITSLAFTPDSQTLVGSVFDGPVKLWQVGSQH
jgi:WD40 repeat protein